MMILWCVSALRPAARLPVRGVSALAICWLVELGQILHAPALDAVRSTTPGHLVLGSDFDVRDLAMYAAGICAAALLDRLLFRPTPAR